MSNIPRCVIATLCVVAALCVGSARAQASGEAAALAVDQTPPDPLATMRAYQAVDRWVRAWEVSPGAELPVARAAAVILRLDGEVIGRGIDVAQRPEGDANVTVIAARAALAEAEGRLGVARDALYHDNLREVARRIAVSIELAGPLVPWSPKDWSDATLGIEPGMEGVAVRMGDRTMAMFPIAMMVMGMEPAAAYAGLVSRLADDPTMGLKAPTELEREHGVTFYRFRTSHIAQTRAGGAPEFLHRGGKVFELRELDAEELRRWADELARHLVERDRRGATLNPIAAEFDEESLASQAIVSLALRRYAKATGQPEGEAAVAADAELYNVGQQLEGAVLSDPTVMALVSVRASEGWMPGEGEPLPLIRIAGKSAGALAPFESGERAIEGLPTGLRGLMAHGLVAGGRRPNPSFDPVRVAFRLTPPSLAPAEMPWLGWAELAVHEGGEIPSAVALRNMRDLMWQHQLRAFELPAEQRDLAGAIVFTKAGPGQRLMPTWHMARPLAFIATMLGDERLTSDEEVPQELSRLLASLRFLRQLTAGEAEAHMYRSPEKSIGGVRASLWDQRMAPEATAMTLMAVCETIRSLEKIEERRRQGAGEQGNK